MSLVGPRAGLDATVKKSIPIPGGNRTLVVQQIFLTINKNNNNNNRV
jgi:hypothetical protein